MPRPPRQTGTVTALVAPSNAPVLTRGLQNRRAYGHAPGTGGSAAACIQNGSPICPGGTGYAPMGAGGTGYAPTGAGGTGYAPMGAAGTGYAPTGAAGTGYVIGYAPMGTGGTGYAPMGAGSTGYAPTGAGGAEYVIGYAPMGAGGIWYAPTGAGGTGDAPVGAWVMTVITHSPLTLAKSRKGSAGDFPARFRPQTLWALSPRTFAWP